MPGPNSAPNGDISLTADVKFYCDTHKTYDLSHVKASCVLLRKRDLLARQNQLRTGKTQRAKA